MTRWWVIDDDDEKSPPTQSSDKHPSEDEKQNKIYQHNELQQLYSYFLHQSKMEDNPINIHQQSDHNGQRDHTKTSKNSISSIDRRGQEDGSPSNDNQYYRNNNNGMMFHDNNNYYYSNEDGNDDYINERRIQHHYDNHSGVK